MHRGLDLLAPDRPTDGPTGTRVARIPVKRPAMLRYRRQGEQVGFVDGFGAGVHSVMTTIDDEWVALAHFVRHGQPDRAEPGFRYRLEDAEHQELALIESARSLNLAAGAPHWTCTATDGGVVEARPHVLTDRQVRQLPDRFRRAVRRRPPSTEPGVWAGNPVNGRDGWDLLDADGETIAWLTPPATAYSTSFAVVGPDGTSLEELDPAVLLFGYFVLFGELQRHGGRALPISSD